MPDLNIPALRAAAEAATKGEWRYLSGSHGVRSLAGAEDKAVCTLNGPRRADAQRDANAAYIIAACNALPALLDRVERLEERGAELEAMRAAADYNGEVAFNTFAAISHLGIVEDGDIDESDPSSDAAVASIIKPVTRLLARATAAEAERDRMKAALESIAAERPCRSGYDQSDVDFEPAMSATEARQAARAALAGEKEPTNGA